MIVEKSFLNYQLWNSFKTLAKSWWGQQNGTRFWKASAIFLQCYAHNIFDKSSNPGQNREARTHYGPKKLPDYMSAYPTTGRLIQLGASLLPGNRSVVWEKSNAKIVHPHPRLAFFDNLLWICLLQHLDLLCVTWFNSLMGLIFCESWIFEIKFLWKGKFFFLGQKWKWKLLVAVFMNSQKRSPDGRGVDN